MAKVAFCSPLPPAQTGIAAYATAVLGGLDEIGFTAEHQLDPMWPLGPGAEERVRASDVGVFQLGNNVEFHGAIYRLSVWNPGVVVLHDLALDGLMYGLGLANDPLTLPARAEAMAAAARNADLEDPLGVPWCAQAVRRARTVIVHSRFARDYLLRAGCRTPIVVTPHPLVERDDEIDAARERRARLRHRVARGDEVVVGIAGDLNASKGIEALLAAFPRVRSNVRGVLVGRTSSHWDVQGALRRSGVGDRVTVVTDVRDDEFLEWLCAFDILINLRHPHRGETSGSLVRALHAGVPTIVSAVGSYLEVPDGVVVRIAPGPPDPVELATAIDRLAEDPEARASMSRHARDYARSALAPRVTAAGYAEAVHRVLELNADPVRTSIARWARGLRAAGVGPQHAARGLGVRYAEALFELRPEPPG